jgi:hypothetical protein
LRWGRGEDSGIRLAKINHPALFPSAPVGQTDFTLLEQQYIEVYKVNKPYAVIDRLNTVNARLRNAKGESALLIHPKCTNLIRVLETLTYTTGTKTADKLNPGIHISDALGYLIMGVFPLIPRNDWSVYPVHL